MAKESRRGELAFLKAVRRQAGAPTGAVRLGIGDDCAILRPPPNHDLLVTTDFSLEGRHFRRDWHTGQSAGHRCLARGLSDIAAMGGSPISAFLSLALPPDLRSSAEGNRWVDSFFRGLLALAKATGTQLSGGDTAASPGRAILADIVLLGSAPRNRALQRRGARPGDRIYVTGALGGAAAELQTLQGDPSLSASAQPAVKRGPRPAAQPAEDIHPHLFPAPRLKVGQALLRRGLATAAIDLSDGLSTDLRHLCDESGVGAVLEAANLPIHPLANTLVSRSDTFETSPLHCALQLALQLALHGGEDYELLFTARPSTRMPGRIAGIPITHIGEITRGKALRLRSDGRDRPLTAGGWEHTL